MREINSAKWRTRLMTAAVSSVICVAATGAETVAFWAFDEPVGLYPSSVLSDQSAHAYTLVLGPGGSVVPGKFGRGFSTAPQPEIKYPPGSVMFGLTQAPTPQGRTVEPLSWINAKF